MANSKLIVGFANYASQAFLRKVMPVHKLPGVLISMPIPNTLFSLKLFKNWAFTEFRPDKFQTIHF